MKKGFALVTAIIFLLVFSFLASEILRYTKLQMQLFTQESAHIQTINKLRSTKYTILSKHYNCDQVELAFDDARFEVRAYLDFSNKKECASVDDARFINSNGIVVVNLYAKDKIYNLSSYERFYKK